MDRYPEHTFAVSQAQQFKWLEKLYPKLFNVVRSKIDEGRFQPIGGCWVESASTQRPDLTRAVFVWVHRL